MGIMTLAIKTLIHSWAVPYMNARHWVVTAFSDNIASQRVFIKNGFQYSDTIPNALDLTAKGCGIKGLVVYNLSFPEVD